MEQGNTLMREKPMQQDSAPNSVQAMCTGVRTTSHMCEFSMLLEFWGFAPPG